MTRRPTSSARLALCAVVFVAACAQPEPPSPDSKDEAPPAVIHFANRPGDVVRVEGTIEELASSLRLAVTLEPRRSALGLSVASLPWPAVERSLELREASRTDAAPLRRGDLARFASGEADYTLVPARRRVPVRDTVRRGGRLVAAELDPDPPDHAAQAPELEHFVLADAEAALEYTFPALVEEHALEVLCRTRTGGADARSSSGAVTLHSGGVLLARAELTPVEGWQTLRLPLRLEPGLVRLSLRAETGTSAIDVAWVELQHAERDLVVWNGVVEARHRADYVPARTRELAPLHRGTDGLVYSLRSAGPVEVLALDPEAELSVSSVPSELPSLLAHRVEGASGWVRLHPPDGLGAGRLSLPDEPLWRESEPAAPKDPVLALALSRLRVAGDRRPCLWLPAGSSLDLRARPAAGDRLRFAVGLPDAALDEASPRSASSASDSAAPGASFHVSWVPDEGSPLELDRLAAPPAAQDAPRAWIEREVRIDERVFGPGVLRWEVRGATPVSAAFADPRLVSGGAPDDGRPNLVVYVIDTLRADHLSCYGSRNPTSPRLDRLAAEGFRFERFYAVAPWTRPTTATLLTGYYPRWHGMGRELPLPFSLETLAETLARKGYSAWGAVANPQVGGSTLQFSQGFHRFVDHTGIGEPGDDPRAATSRRLNTTVLPWLEAFGDEPFFLYLHSLDPHTPYAPPPDAEAPFGRDYRGPMFEKSLRRKQLLESAHLIGEADRRYVEDVYDNEILYQDRQLGVLIDELARLSLLDETVIAVLSDHGEEFLEHGDWNHGYRMWEEQLRVPLIVWLPGPLRERLGLEPRVVSETVSQVDFLPGLLELVGVQDDFPRQGRSWLPLLSGREAGLLPFHGEDFQAWEGDEIGAFRRGSHKLIWTRYEGGAREVARLYDLERDPAEREDLAEQRPELVRELQAERDALVEFTARVRDRHVEAGRTHVMPAGDDTEPAQLTPEELRELEALGYVQAREDD